MVWGKKEERANITKYFNDQQKIGQTEWIKYWLNDNSIMRTWNIAIISMQTECILSVLACELSFLPSYPTQNNSVDKKICCNTYFIMQSNPLNWVALGHDYDYPLRQSIHLSMFYTLHCV